MSPPLPHPTRRLLLRVVTVGAGATMLGAQACGGTTTASTNDGGDDVHVGPAAGVVAHPGGPMGTEVGEGGTQGSSIEAGGPSGSVAEEAGPDVDAGIVVNEGGEDSPIVVFDAAGSMIEDAGDGDAIAVGSAPHDAGAPDAIQGTIVHPGGDAGDGGL